MAVANKGVGVKKGVGLAFGAALLVLVGYGMPCPPGMSAAAQQVLGVCAFALSVWLCDSMPIGMSSCLAMLLLPMLGVMPLTDALAQFMQPATFFVVATFSISCALSKTPLSARILRAMLRVIGIKTERVVLAIMVSTALLSTVMSNVPVTAMMTSVALAILGRMRAAPGQSNIGRTLMIGVPFAAMVGGIITPAGSPVNIIAINLLAETTGESITFLGWMLYGAPLAIVLLPLGWVILLKAFKPEPIPQEVVALLLHPADVPDRFTRREIKGLVITGLTLAAWILGGWVPALDMTVVAALAMIAFFLPGVNVFSWEDFASSISWDLVFTTGSVMAVGTAVVTTGLGDWIVQSLFSGAQSWPLLALLLAVAFATNLIHLILPIAPAIVTMILPSLLMLAQSAGLDTVAFAVVVAMMATCAMLLPVGTLTLLTYGKKYYTTGDLLKSGVPYSCIWAVLTALWAYALSLVF